MGSLLLGGSFNDWCSHAAGWANVKIFFVNSMDDRVEKRQTNLPNHLKDYILNQMSENSSSGVLNEHLLSEIHDKSKGAPPKLPPTHMKSE